MTSVLICIAPQKAQRCWTIRMDCILPKGSHRFLPIRDKGPPPLNSWGVAVQHCQRNEKGSWATLPQPRDVMGTELEVETIVVVLIYFRPSELTFTQRKQRVNPISELSKDQCWIHYRQISFFNTVHWIAFCGIPIPSKCWFRIWLKIEPEFIVQWQISGNKLT